MMPAANTLRKIWTTAVDFLFPAKCLVCGDFLESARRFNGDVGTGESDGEPASALPRSAVHLTDARLLCHECAQTVKAVREPVCDCCGMMFASREGDNHLCADCLQSPKAYGMARAAFVYDQAMMTLIQRFKYQGKVQLADPFGRALFDAMTCCWTADTVDVVVPVPLHAARFRKRGFNQSYLLVRNWKRFAGGRRRNIPVVVDALLRAERTSPQTGLGRKERLKNIRHAFRVQSPGKIVDRRVLLVDDVFTTGATAGECARVLLDAGARSVDVLTLARAM
jgi:ComF family protein